MSQKLKVGDFVVGKGSTYAPDNNIGIVVDEWPDGESFGVQWVHKTESAVSGGWQSVVSADQVAKLRPAKEKQRDGVFVAAQITQHEGRIDTTTAAYLPTYDDAVRIIKQCAKNVEGDKLKSGAKYGVFKLLRTIKVEKEITSKTTDVVMQ